MQHLKAISVTLAGTAAAALLAGAFAVAQQPPTATVTLPSAGPADPGAAELAASRRQEDAPPAGDA